MKPAVGHDLAGFKLLNYFGITVSGPLTLIFVSGPAREYSRTRREIKPRIEPNSTSNVNEQHCKLTTYPIGWDGPFEEQDQFVTSSRHPMVDFNAIGRTDNVIVLATGEKAQFMVLEMMLTEHSLVSAAVGFGNGHFHLGVIVKPSHAASPDGINEFKITIWPIVLEANDFMDANARIACKAIIVVPYAMTLPRSDKSSLLRRDMYAVLNGEIEQAYQHLELSSVSQKGQFILDRNGGIAQLFKNLTKNALLK